MRTRLSRRRRLLVPILLAGVLSLGASVAAGLQPSPPRNVAESAFQPVVLPSGMPGRGEGVPRAGMARAADPPPIADPWLGSGTPPADRARPQLPATKPIAVARPTYTHSISGRASWYCDAGVSPCTASYPDGSGFDAYGAAGPRLRAAIGSDWRGTVVLVDGIRVKLIDWCQCYAGESNEKLIDLYRDVFLRTGSPVTIRW